MKQKQFSFTIQEEDQNFKRLDLFLADACKHQDVSLSRQQIKNIFAQGLIVSETGKLELKKLPKVGTIISLTLPEMKPSTANAEDLPLDILFEDSHLIVVNKAAGMVTHPAPGNYNGTLVNAVLHHCKDLQGVGDEMRPGIVHRLDKGTSGVMVVAKTQATHNGLTTLFSTHDISRKYEAIILGVNNAITGKLDAPIGRNPHNRLKMAINVAQSKEAITFYKVLKEYDPITHLELKLETGRTHQIRVHLSSLLKRPIFMDELYGNPKQDLQRVSLAIREIASGHPHPFLHAKHLGFTHPITGEELEFNAPAPEIFQKVLHAAENNL